MAKQFENKFGDKIITPKGRLYYFDIDTPNTKDKHPNNLYPSDKFDVTIGFKNGVDLSDAIEKCNAVAVESFGSTDGVAMPFHNGDEKSQDNMKGYIIARAKCSKRPGCVDENKEQLTEGEIDGGMFGRLSVTPMTYKSGVNKGVTLVLKNIQVYTNLEYDSLSGGASAADDFED